MTQTTPRNVTVNILAARYLPSPKKWSVKRVQDQFKLLVKENESILKAVVKYRTKLQLIQARCPHENVIRDHLGTQICKDCEYCVKQGY